MKKRRRKVFKVITETYQRLDRLYLEFRLEFRRRENNFGKGVIISFIGGLILSAGVNYMQQPQMLEDLGLSVSQVPYQVRLAKTSEFDKIFRLRYEIFFKEMGAQSEQASRTQLDYDPFDDICDHLVVLQGKEVVGTYRLLPLSRLNKKNRVGTEPLQPYSQSEFDLSPIRARYGDEQILELGRSCIHADHRGGQTARLLWAGIAKYLLENNIRCLIGCVSVHGISHLQANRLAATFQKDNFWHPEFSLAVQKDFDASFTYEECDKESLVLVPQDATKLLPPLMKGYVNLGAKVCGGPAYDSEFHCHDYLMLLDYSDISPRYFNSLVKPLIQRGMLGNMHASANEHTASSQRVDTSSL